MVACIPSYELASQTSISGLAIGDQVIKLVPWKIWGRQNGNLDVVFAVSWEVGSRLEKNSRSDHSQLSMSLITFALPCLRGNQSLDNSKGRINVHRKTRSLSPGLSHSPYSYITDDESLVTNNVSAVTK